MMFGPNCNRVNDEGSGNKSMIMDLWKNKLNQKRLFISK